MRLQTLLSDLRSPQPETRIAAARVLGLVEETLALEAIRKAFLMETEPNAKQAINWGGGRIHAAQKRSYTTLDDIFERFKINQELENMEDPDEAAFIETMSTNFEIQLQHEKNAANMKTAAMGAGAALAGVAQFGAAGLSMGGMTPGANVLSSNIGVERPEVGKQRIPAQAPTEMGFEVWLRRLREDRDPAVRAKAAFEISQFNNPAALPRLAELFFAEQDPKVQNAIIQAAKTLYLNARYWEITQDGSLEAEIERRAAAMGKKTRRTQTMTMAAVSPETATPDTGQLPPDKRATQTQELTKEELAEILRRGQEARMKRQKK